MFYRSTRNSAIKVTAAEAVVKGISEDGGLFVPSELPKLGMDEIVSFSNKTYAERAFDIFKLFLTDFTDDEIKGVVNSAYGDNFETENPAPLSHLLNGTYILELWHGPTCAFKDMALQALPFLMTAAARKAADGKEIAILVATSGDTGKAALEGFKDVQGTKIMVFYPENGVSEMQKRQMTTQKGKNVSVCAVNGNFDDCQSGVKAIFADKETSETLKEKDILLSSANSINWGRLLPQIVYYISAYAELVSNEEINCGDEINVVVPTGNFGNILAAYYAKEMGIPIKKLICASNKNKILTDFIKSGIYDRNREFYTTISPSMDILISSNLERLLYHLSSDKSVISYFEGFSKNGKYEVSDTIREKLNCLFYGGFCEDEDAKKTIKDVFDAYSYLLDTHTAVAYKVYSDYKKETNDKTKTIVVSTANPYKFVSSVFTALSETPDGVGDEFAIAKELEKLTGTKIPAPLAAIEKEQVRFDKTVAREKMLSAVYDFLEI